MGLGAAVPAVEEGGPSLAGVCCVRDGLIWFAMREGERGGGQGGGREDKCVSTYCCGRPAMEEGDRGGGGMEREGRRVLFGKRVVLGWPWGRRRGGGGSVYCLVKELFRLAMEDKRRAGGGRRGGGGKS